MFFTPSTYIAYVVEVSLPKRSARGGRAAVWGWNAWGSCAVDCGVAINPLGVAQQVESGVVWSLSNMKSEITVKNGAVEQGFIPIFQW